jgi:DNA-binding winged helix-turn-helix (wHTH) protein
MSQSSQEEGKSPRGTALCSEFSIRLGRAVKIFSLQHLSFSIRTEVSWAKGCPPVVKDYIPVSSLTLEDSFLVGQWLVLPQLNSIEREGQKARIEPKAMGVLRSLSHRPGTVVSKERLIHEVWPDVFVTDDVLKGCIWQLRRAFQDNYKCPTVIETIPKAGYRLLLPVSNLQPGLTL